MTAHIPRAAHALPSVRIIVAGVRKIPTPTTWLTTMAVADQEPKCALPAFVFTFGSDVNVTRSEGDSGSELHCPWPSRPEDAASRCDRLAEFRGAEVCGIGRIFRIAHQHVGEPGVVHIRHA